MANGISVERAGLQSVVKLAYMNCRQRHRRFREVIKVQDPVGKMRIMQSLAILSRNA